METWKAIRTLNNYELSNYGRVRSIDRTVSSTDGLTTRTYKGKLIKINNHRNGYKIISICEGNVKKNYCLHQLIALNAFDNYDPAIHVIDHINGDKSDNRVENLRVTTNRMNLSNKKNNSVYGVNVYRTSSGKFNARIMIKGIRCNLGTYIYMEQAQNEIKELIDKVNHFEMNGLDYKVEREVDLFGSIKINLIEK